MKTSVQNTQQIDRTIQTFGVNQKKKFVDNRPNRFQFLNKDENTQPMQLAPEIKQLHPNKIVLPTARNHYHDGWGARYNIQNDVALKAEILDEDSDAGAIDLRVHDAPELEQPHPPDGTRMRKRCSIAYRDASEANTTAIFHCGPSGKPKWYNVT